MEPETTLPRPRASLRTGGLDQGRQAKTNQSTRSECPDAFRNRRVGWARLKDRAPGHPGRSRSEPRQCGDALGPHAAGLRERARARARGRFRRRPRPAGRSRAPHPPPRSRGQPRSRAPSRHLARADVAGHRRGSDQTPARAGLRPGDRDSPRSPGPGRGAAGPKRAPGGTEAARGATWPPERPDAYPVKRRRAIPGPDPSRRAAQAGGQRTDARLRGRLPLAGGGAISPLRPEPACRPAGGRR